MSGGYVEFRCPATGAWADERSWGRSVARLQLRCPDCRRWWWPDEVGWRYAGMSWVVYPRGRSRMIEEADLQRWFTYHPPTPEQQEHYVAIRDAALVFARTLVLHTPSSPDQTVAVRKVREAVMVANASIACEGR